MSTPTSRKAAQAAGLNTYQPAKPCKRGHLAPRHVTKGCTQCQAERRRRQHTARVLSGRWLDTMASTIDAARETIDPKAPPAWSQLAYVDSQRLALVVAHVVTRPRVDTQQASVLTIAQDIADALGLRGNEHAQAIGAGFLGMAVDCGFVQLQPATLADVWPGRARNRNPLTVVVLSAEAEKQRTDIAASLAASDIPPRPLLEIPPVRIDITPNRDDLDPPPMPVSADAIAGALAAIQSTAWRVNKYLLNVLESMAPAVSFGMDAQAQTSAVDVLEQARHYADAPAFYFPITFDWRGRMYQKGGRLQYTGGSDIARALLEFSDGAPLTSDGFTEFGAHIAALYGVKGALTERMKWTVAHGAQIIAVARDPGQVEHFAFWQAAHKPFQFLAACDAWRRVEENAGAAIHLPVAFDATASGLQHFALLLRDVELAGRVNLLARSASVADAPKDIYEAVARGSGETRAIVKNPVMTFFYGQREGALAQALAGMAGTRFPAKDSPVWTRARAIRDATRTIAPGAWNLYGALCKVAGALADARQPIEWTTPDGFRVRQANRELETRMVDLWLWPGPWKLQARKRVLLQELDRAKQIQGFAPNLVHSLDACLMRSVVLEAPHIQAWGVAHDCFAVHPNAGGVFRDAAARAIRGMYGPDVLGGLWSGWGVGEAPSHGVTLPEEIGAGWYTFS